MPRDTLLAEAERLYASLPQPRVLTRQTPRPPLVSDDPRLSPPPPPQAAALKPEEQKKLQRAQKLIRELKLDRQQGLPPEKAVRMLQNPKFQELQRLAAELGGIAALDQESVVQWEERRDAYDSATRRWLAISGWRRVKSISGRAALIESVGGRPGRVVLNTFTTTKVSWHVPSGRLCFSGPCTLRMSEGEGPTQTIERRDPATTQLFLGQDGYFLKFAELRAGGSLRPQPFVYSGLLCAHLDALPATLGDPGLLQGLPFEGAEKEQRGGVEWPDPQRPGCLWRVAWEFQPV